MKQKYSITDWQNLINESPLNKKEKEEKLILVKKAYENNMPVIINLTHLSNLLGLKEGIVASMIHSPNSFYRKFKIPKKRGGYRDITTPYQSLLEAQQWIVKHILSKFEIHEAAHAYVEKRNIAINARKHIGCKEMLKIDLKDFFPSIKIPRVRELFNRKGYSKEIAGYLTKLCCLEGSIPQGASSSPMISNIILNTLDKRLSNFSKNNNITYTRYADDLVFSGTQIPLNFETLVTMNIENSGFVVNTKKTKYYKEGRGKVVTGIIVGEKDIRLPKTKRRQIKNEVHFLKTFKVLHQVKRYNDIYYVDRVLGKLSYWKQIEPKNEYVLNSIKEIKRMYKKFLEE